MLSGQSSEYSMKIANQVLMNRKSQKNLQEEYKTSQEITSKRSRYRVTSPEAAPIRLVRYDANVDSITFSKELLEKTGVLF